MESIINTEIKIRTESYNELVRYVYGDWACIETNPYFKGDTIRSYFNRLLLIVEAVDVSHINHLSTDVKERYESISIEYITNLHSFLSKYIKN